MQAPGQSRGPQKPDPDAADASDAGVATASTSQGERSGNVDMGEHGHAVETFNQFSPGAAQESIRQLDTALKLATSIEQEYDLLLQRSAALFKLSEGLRAIPASYSEAHALIGYDPFYLAQVALKDAVRAADIHPDKPAPRCLQGNALVLLEQYAQAEEAYLEGLSLDPTNQQLHSALHSARAIVGADAEEADSPTSADAKRSSKRRLIEKPERLDDFECTLCMHLLYEPVTTPCGHTFCRDCFSRSIDHSSRCPMCRTILHVGKLLPVTITLKNILQKSFPEEYEQAARERAGPVRGPVEGTGEAPLPLFVMATMMPGEKMALTIFEPRYRLMVRRCMEGARRLGMASARLVDAQPQDSIGCECEIIECQPLPDGRFYIEIRAVRRFRIASSWEQDGYRVALPEYFHDDRPTQGSQEAAELLETAAEVEQLVDEYLSSVRSVIGRRAARLMELLQRAGERPSSTADPEGLSWWVANLMTVDGLERLALLRMTSTLQRMRRQRDSLQHLAACRDPLNCCIM